MTTVRFRRFEKMGLAETRVSDAGPGERDKIEREIVKLPRRYAVMAWLGTLDPQNVYGMVEEAEMGLPIATVVYYRSENGDADRPRDTRPLRDTGRGGGEAPPDQPLQ